MIKQDFLDSGYKEYPSGLESNWATCLLQKRMNDENGKCKYYLNVYPSEVTEKLTFTTKVQFNRGNDTFNIDMFDRDENTIEYIEKCIDDLWFINSMDYHE